MVDQQRLKFVNNGDDEASSEPTACNRSVPPDGLKRGNAISCRLAAKGLSMDESDHSWENLRLSPDGA